MLISNGILSWIEDDDFDHVMVQLGELTALDRHVALTWTMFPLWSSERHRKL